jgi:hypothetical protein
MKTAIEMAKEAGFMLRAESVAGQDDWWECFDSEIETLVALVRADERKAEQAEHEADKIIIEYHEATIKRLEAEIRAEREALETLYADAQFIFNNPPGETSQEVRDVIEWYASAIRARSNT